MSYKIAKKTYKSRKIEAGPIDPKEILQAVNDHNSLFDALSIKNIRKYKKDCLFTDLPHCSKNTKKKRNLKLSRKTNSRKTSDEKYEVPHNVPPQYSPDKSLHVKRHSDPFDKLFGPSENVEVRKCDKEKFDPRINLSSDSDDSVSFNKSVEIREAISNAGNSPPEFHLSTPRDASPVPMINSTHDLSEDMLSSHDPSVNIQSWADTSKKVFFHKFEIDHIDSCNENTSIDKMLNNINAIKALKKCQMEMSPYVNNKQLECECTTVSSTPLRPEPTSSTPFSKITNQKPMYNFSPIQRNCKTSLDNGNQDDSTFSTNQANVLINHSSTKENSDTPKAIISTEILEYCNQDESSITVKSDNNNSMNKKKNHVPSIGMTKKHLQTNLKTSIDLFESSLDDSTNANYSVPLKKTSFNDKTEGSINDINNANYNDHNVENSLIEPVNEQNTRYAMVSFERLRDLIFQERVCLYEVDISSKNSEFADTNNDSYSESKYTQRKSEKDLSKSNLKSGNPKVCLRNFRESILQQHLQKCTEDMKDTKFDSNSLKHKEDLSEEIIRIRHTPIYDEKIDLVNIDHVEFEQNGYEIPLEAIREKCIEDKENTDNMMHNSLFRRDCDDETLLNYPSHNHQESSILSDDRTCNSEENFLHYFSTSLSDNITRRRSPYVPINGHLHQNNTNNKEKLCTNNHQESSILSDDRTCNSEENFLHYFSTSLSDNITRRRSPYVPINGHLHQNNTNNKEKLCTNNTTSSPILNTDRKREISQKKITSQTLDNTTSSFDNKDCTSKSEASSLNNSYSSFLASNTLLETRLSSQMHVSAKSKKKNSGKLVDEKCNLLFQEMSTMNHAHDLSQYSRNKLKNEHSPKMNNAITPNREICFASQNKNDFEFIKPSIRNSIVLQPGKKWERSLSIIRRLTLKNDETLIEIDSPGKGRRYRQSIANVMDLQQNRDSILMQCADPKKRDAIDVLDIQSRRSTIRIVMEPLQADCRTTITEEEVGFLSESCNDTFIDLSKLSISNVDNSSPLLDNIIDVSDRITSRDVVLRRCNQTDCLPFDDCYTDVKLKNCRKIGEGVYGEVFLYRGEDGRARVMKVVPVDGKLRVNGELQKNFDEILSEIIIAMELSALRAPIDDLKADAVSQGSCQFEVSPSIENATDTFNEVLAVNCVYGRYPARLLDLWQLYDESRGSENDSPATFDDHQQYIVLELANGGQDLESFQFNNAEQAYAVFYQVAFALAVAEEAYQFEHRDLHWGNVLCTPADDKFATYVLRGATYRLPRKGVCATIIDYTLSRVSLPLAGATTQATLYNDLGADPTLFEAEGDYQFDVYRLMRERNGNSWKEFEPYTNILWLHYLLDKMITALRYNRVSTKIHKHYIGKLKELKGKILSFESTIDFVLNDNEI